MEENEKMVEQLSLSPPRSPPPPPPPLSIFQQHATIEEEEEEEDDFGDFAVAADDDDDDEPVFLPLPPLSSKTTPPPRAHVTPSTNSSPRSNKPGSPPRLVDGSFRRFLAMAAPNVAHQLEEEDSKEGDGMPKDPFQVFQSTVNFESTPITTTSPTISIPASPRNIKTNSTTAAAAAALGGEDGGFEFGSPTSPIKYKVSQNGDLKAFGSTISLVEQQLAAAVAANTTTTMIAPRHSASAAILAVAAAEKGNNTININNINDTNGAAAVHVKQEEDDDDFGDFSGNFGDFSAAPEPLSNSTNAAQQQQQQEEEQMPAPPAFSAFMSKLGTHAPPSPHINKFTANGKNTCTTPAVQEYGVAWAEMLKAAAEKLESGVKIWNACSLDVAIDNKTTSIAEIQAMLMQNNTSQRYFAALGRIYFVASLVRLAADALGLLRFVHELEMDWARCSTAWSVLAAPALNAAERLGIPLLFELQRLEKVEAVLPSLSMDEFPRMLVWNEGLDALTLIPYIAFEGSEGEQHHQQLRTIDWPEGRQTLSDVAHFWLGCVSAVAPDLE